MWWVCTEVQLKLICSCTCVHVRPASVWQSVTLEPEAKPEGFRGRRFAKMLLITKLITNRCTLKLGSQQSSAELLLLLTSQGALPGSTQTAHLVGLVKLLFNFVKPHDEITQFYFMTGW